MITTQIQYIGDDWNIPLTLGTEDSNGVFTPLSISLSATVVASLISRDEDILIAPTAQSNASPNADWANGIVAVVFTNTETSALPANESAFIEIEIDTGGLLNTFQSEPDILIKRAYIT